MKHAVLIALCGLSLPAAAAPTVRLAFNADVSELLSNDTARWTVTAEFDGVSPTGYFGGFVGTFLAENAADFQAHSFVNGMSGQGTPPVANGGSVGSVNIFNSALLGTDDQANPLVIFTFETTVVNRPLDTQPRFISFDAEGVASVFLDDGIFSLPTELRDGDVGFEVVSDTVFYSGIIPAPGAGVVLAGGLVLTRRRRGA